MGVDVERAAVNVAQQHVDVADDQLPVREAHRGAASAAATGLHEHHQAAPGGTQATDRLMRRGGDRKPRSCGNVRHLGSEQTEWLGAVADQQVLGLAEVVEHHPVVLPADARDLVPAECRPSWVLADHEAGAESIPALACLIAASWGVGTPACHGVVPGVAWRRRLGRSPLRRLRGLADDGDV